MLYIGVDLGTSAVKLLLMEGSGKIVNIVSKEYPLFFPHPGWSEQKPEDWYEQSMARIKELIASGETFAMETTLATRSGAKLIREAQKEGYYVTLLYFWLNTPDLAVERVKMRVAAGGHNIPESTIRRRYEAGIHNLFELYIPICDYWMIADNSMSPMEVIAKGFRSEKKEIYNSNIYTKLEHHE